jgi:hypothetical protein
MSKRSRRWSSITRAIWMTGSSLKKLKTSSLDQALSSIMTNQNLSKSQSKPILKVAFPGERATYQRDNNE